MSGSFLLVDAKTKLTYLSSSWLSSGAPRTARNPSEKSEPYGNEAHRFASKFMQRDVEVDFESVDKTGGFIGGESSRFSTTYARRFELATDLSFL